ncbi:MAG: hypothetical protein HS111_32185 [Kofleriaceae bacterium]|nr:hypothetical protein [Kofleriaceae bacterium]
MTSPCGALDGACALADLRPRNPIGADDLHLLLLRRAQIDVRLHQLAQQLVPLGADEALDLAQRHPHRFGARQAVADPVHRGVSLAEGLSLAIVFGFDLLIGPATLPATDRSG